MSPGWRRARQPPAKPLDQVRRSVPYWRGLLAWCRPARIWAKRGADLGCGRSSSCGHTVDLRQIEIADRCRDLLRVVDLIDAGPEISGCVQPFRIPGDMLARDLQTATHA